MYYRFKRKCSIVYLQHKIVTFFYFFCVRWLSQLSSHIFSQFQGINFHTAAPTIFCISSSDKRIQKWPTFFAPNVMTTTSKKNTSSLRSIQKNVEVRYASQKILFFAHRYVTRHGDKRNVEIRRGNCLTIVTYWNNFQHKKFRMSWLSKKFKFIVLYLI